MNTRARLYFLLLGFLVFGLFSCSDVAEKADPQFKQAFDEQSVVYRDVLRKNAFTGSDLPPLYDQLPHAQLRSGDVILRLMAGASSILTSFSSLGGYSHVGVILREGDSLMVVDCQPHNAAVMGEHCIKKHRLYDWVQDFTLRGDVTPVLSVMIMRARDSFSQEALTAAVNAMLYGKVRFDSQFALNNDLPEQQNLYCSEFVYVLFQPVLKRDDLVYYADPITNKLIEHVLILEKQNRYPEFCRMLHVIEERFHVKMRGVKNLIAPSVFESSSAFAPVFFARHPDLASSSYLPLMKMYAYLQRAVIMLRSLHGLPFRSDVEAEMAYAGLPSEQKQMIRKVIAGLAANGLDGKFSSNQLVSGLLSEYAGSEATFAMVGKAIAKMERPQGHGRGED